MSEATTRLREELEHLEEFLASPGYLAAKKVNDAEYQDGINLILDLSVESDGDVYKLLAAQGEVRALRKFTQRFKDRVDEIKELLEKQPEPIDQ